MKLNDGDRISGLIEDPVKETSSNINQTQAFFFHGTRKGLLPLIKAQGFNVVPKRPVFTLDPIYSMGYCRKSESYLRGLIKTGNKQKLQEEIDDLISKKVIKEADPKDTEYQWWITKANEYYESQSDIVNDGILLAFSWPVEDMEEAPESTIIFKKKGEDCFLEGVPSYWRTRQFYFKTGKTFQQKGFLTIELEKEFVKQTKELNSITGKGKLSSKMWEKTVNSINLKQTDSLKVSLLSQIVESRLLKELRDLLTGVLKSKNLKVFWKQGNDYLEDPRWNLSESQIEEKIKNFQKNEYPYQSWEQYTKAKLSLICELMK